MAGGFHPLRVADVERLTDDAVAVTFAVPPELRASYRYAAGQHIAVRLPSGNRPAADAGGATPTDGRQAGGGRSGGERSAGGRDVSGQDVGEQADGGEVRRTYSICAPAPGPEGPATLRVGVRLVEGGVFSTYANKELAAGDTVDVMAPAGRFAGKCLAEPETPGAIAPRPGHYAAVVGGSGITPVLSVVYTFLAENPDTRFCLVRCDRTAASTMFLDEVADLKDRYPDRFQLVQVLTREETQAGLDSGRLDAPRLTAMLPALLPVDQVAGWFLCGPYPLIEQSYEALRQLGVARSLIHQEVFHAGDLDTAAGQTVGLGVEAGQAVGSRVPGGTVKAVLDGRSGSWPSQDGESVLDTVIRNRADAPYACRGGVCGTCRTFLVAGTVRMDRNFALEPEELEAGYVLACQSHPTSPAVEVDFDR